MRKTALITGATSGIGYATAVRLSTEGFNLVICGRNDDKLKELSDLLSTKGLVFSLCFDVADKIKVKEAIASIPSNFNPISILVNNAGNAHGLDFFDEADEDDWDKMIDSNLRGVLYVTKTVLPSLIASCNGHIVNISSTAGKEVYPKGNVYCATKHAVEALSQGMRIDLNRHGIKVTNIAPGMVETSFSEVRFKGDKAKAKNVYAGMEPLVATDIADAIYYAISRPTNVHIADMTILAGTQASATIVKRKSE